MARTLRPTSRTLGIQETVATLLQTSTSDQEAARLCDHLTQLLQSLKQKRQSDDDDDTAPTVRNTLDLNNTDLSRLTHRLTRLMNDRVELSDLMPMTYDEQANQEAMEDEAAPTLTHASLVAARLYGQLLALPGALGAGFVQMEALSAMVAVVRRFKIESVGGGDEKSSKHKNRSQEKLPHQQNSHEAEAEDDLFEAFTSKKARN